MVHILPALIVLSLVLTQQAAPLVPSVDLAVPARRLG
jgi:hypothetical protein